MGEGVTRCQGIGWVNARRYASGATPVASRSRDVGAVLGPDQVQAQVEATDDARRGQHGPVGGEQDVAAYVGVGCRGDERVEQAPVRRGRAPIEQSGRSEREGARAQRRDPHAVQVRRAQGIDGLGRNRGVRVGASGHDDEVTLAQGGQVVGGGKVPDRRDGLADRFRSADPQLEGADPGVGSVDRPHLHPRP